MAKITPNKLHKVIQAEIGVLSSKYSVSQKIDRTTYDVCNMMKGILGVTSTKYITQIAEALEAADIEFDNSNIDRGFLTLKRIQ